MKHIRLKTVSGTHREIDFIDTAAYSRLPDVSYDAIVRNAEGTQSVYARASRRRLQLQVDGMTAADVEELMQIQGDRQELYVEANVGQYTAVYNPSERSSSPFVGSLSGFARASVASYVDDNGLIHEAASGEIRYETCKIGKGILVEPASTNKLFPSHPASGGYGWAAGAGTPTLAWDTNIASKVYGKTGVLRVIGTTNDTITISVTVTASVSACAFVWVKGCNRVALSASGVSGTTTTGNVQLTMEWQRLALESLTTTGTTVVLTLTLPDAYTTLYVSASQVEERATYTSYIPTTTAAVTRALDQLYYVVGQMNPVEGSISCWMKWPRGNNYTVWYLNSGWFGYIDSSGYLKMAINGGTTNFGAVPSLTAGDIVHVAWVWQEDYAAIVVNGAVLSSNVSMNRDRASAMTAFSHYNGAYSPNAVIDDLRIDYRYVDWTTEYLKFSDAANLALMKFTQARTFRISSYSLAPKEANAQYFDGTIDLEEATSDTNHTLEVA